MKTAFASLAAVAVMFALSGCCCGKCEKSAEKCTKCGTPECTCKH